MIFIRPQNFYENLAPKKNLTVGSERFFGVMMGAIFLVLGGVLLKKDFLILSLLVWGGSFILFALALKAPAKLSYFHLKWMQLGERLRLFFTPIFLTLFFIVVITPMAFILKCFKKDLLRVKKANTNSYWLSAEEVSSFKNQF